MSDVAAHEPLAVGVIGLSPDGLHLIETMCGGGPFRVVMAWDDQQKLARAAESLGVPVVVDLNVLLAAPAVDVLWLARPCGFDEPFAERLVQSGKPIVAELPVGLSVEHVQFILAKARSRGIPVLTHCPRRSDDDFRRARSALRRGDLGKLLAAKWASWSYGRPLTPASATNLGVDESPTGTTLLRLLAHAIDQLLQLIPAEPLRVVAFGDTALSNQSIIEFRCGARAEIDLRLDSPAPVQAHWLLTGDRGGFADGRCFHVAADGEVFDTSTPTIDVDVNQYSNLALRLRVFDHAATETDRAVMATKLLAAILSSVQSGQMTLIPN